ncbi:hypothetical protein E1200_19510 [Actinomadura sp. GC306]|uniref:hypothetical protein n=1 Tax=Actinomadura sp. GC306 TaxID=2530367 RepID=UPI001045608C|nr:hypothetical protein [Actinomadura sp. GC306]TDC64817.1 hypothetical protein E1200_19510 [Actinomadura sp. GC306]
MAAQTIGALRHFLRQERRAPGKAVPPPRQSVRRPRRGAKTPRHVQRPDSGTTEYVLEMARRAPPDVTPHAHAYGTVYDSTLPEQPTLDEMYGQNTGRKRNRAPLPTAHITMIFFIAAKR